MYERSGASSTVSDAAGGAEGLGPDSNSGTSNTTTVTRITAPVSRSFEWVSTMRLERRESSALSDCAELPAALLPGQGGGIGNTRQYS